MLSRKEITPQEFTALKSLSFKQQQLNNTLRHAQIKQSMSNQKEPNRNIQQGGTGFLHNKSSSKPYSTEIISYKTPTKLSTYQEKKAALRYISKIHKHAKQRATHALSKSPKSREQQLKRRPKYLKLLKLTYDDFQRIKKSL